MRCAFTIFAFCDNCLQFPAWIFLDQLGLDDTEMVAIRTWLCWFAGEVSIALHVWFFIMIIVFFFSMLRWSLLFSINCCCRTISVHASNASVFWSRESILVATWLDRWPVYVFRHLMRHGWSRLSLNGDFSCSTTNEIDSWLLRAWVLNCRCLLAFGLLWSFSSSLVSATFDNADANCTAARWQSVTSADADDRVMKRKILEFTTFANDDDEFSSGKRLSFASSAGRYYYNDAMLYTLYCAMFVVDMLTSRRQRCWVSVSPFSSVEGVRILLRAWSLNDVICMTFV